MIKQIRRSVVVISRGFGKGVALQLAEGGASVVLAARRGALLEDLALKCEAMGALRRSRCESAADVERIVHATISTFGRIVWINNAGVAAIGRFEDVPLADHVQVIATDLMATIFGSFFALQHFRQLKYGTLINVASVLGKFPVPYYASYTAAKHGIVIGVATSRNSSES